MKRGVLIFAQNNSEIDYAKIAIFAASRVKEYLDVPVTIVTDSKDWILKSYPNAEELVNFISLNTDVKQTKKFYDGTLFSKTLIWKNLSRVNAFDLTPYDETLVIDSDYIISSNILSNVWGAKNDFLVYRDSVDLSFWRDSQSFKFINQYSIPFYWATVFYFKKKSNVESFFTFIEQIQKNWNYFRHLYNIDSSVYRNDFAFSIALNLFGDNFFSNLPGKMNFTLDRDLLIDIKKNKMKFLVEKKNYIGEYTPIKTEGLDVHVMNKFSLLRCIDGN